MKLRLSNNWIALILVGITVVSVVAWYLFWRDSSKVEELMTGKVTVGDIRNIVSATGTLQAVTTVQVGSQVSGSIQALYADFNSEVKKGQVVAQLDPAIFRAQLNQARANLEQARADVADSKARLSAARATVENLQAGVSSSNANVAALKAQLDDAQSFYKRQEDLFEDGLISNRELESARTGFQAAQARYNQAAAQLEQARLSERTSASAGIQQAQAQVQMAEAKLKQTAAAVELAEANLSHTTIHSPIDGVVVLRNVDVGQTVAASLQAPTIFTIANDLTQMQVIANIDEADIGVIDKTNRVRFTVDAYPGRSFEGAINQVRLNPQNVQNVITYNVVIDVKNPDLKLKPGMTTNLTFYIAERVKVIKIPNAALRFSPQGMTARQIREALPEADRRSEIASSTGPVLEGQFRIVWVPGADKKPQPRVIRIGITDGSTTEVVEGNLKDGESVIVGQNVTGTTQTQNSSQRAPGFGNVPGGGGVRPR
ncbi:MAG: efflux RND transporter periplasmic adaptor subunit [Acidobacteria bacterium]|nr:efflux RND transporter periplasmic adaptor subunit [Acidobacteriota bacterium]